MSDDHPHDVEELLEALHHPASSVRADAVRRLSGLHDTRILAGLVDALDDTTYPVAEDVINALIRLGSPAVVPLIDVVEDRMASTTQRIRAIRVLASIHDARACDPLMSVLRDRSEDEGLRYAAALYLGRLRDGRAMATLLGVVRAPDEVRKIHQAAAGALGELGDPAAVAALIELMAVERDSTVRGRLAQTLGHLGDERALAPLLKLLHDGTTTEQQWAARALSTLGPAAEPAVVGLLTHAESHVRRAALTALPFRPDATLFSPIMAMLKDDPDSGVRAAAASALAHMGDQRMVNPLTAILLRDDEPPEVRQAAASTLGIAACRSVILGDETITALIQASHDEDVRLRCHVLSALGWIAGRQRRSTPTGPDAQIVDALIEAVGDPDALVRRTATQALGLLGVERAVPVLIAALTQRDGPRLEAAQALGRMHATPAVGALVGALCDPERAVRAAAAQALGQMGAAEAVLPLMQALEDEDGAVRVASSGALGQLGDARAVPALERAVQNDDGRRVHLTTVRDAAASAIERLTAR